MFHSQPHVFLNLKIFLSSSYCPFSSRLASKLIHSMCSKKFVQHVISKPFPVANATDSTNVALNMAKHNDKYTKGDSMRCATIRQKLCTYILASLGHTQNRTCNRTWLVLRHTQTVSNPTFRSSRPCFTRFCCAELAHSLKLAHADSACGGKEGWVSVQMWMSSAASSPVFVCT